MSFLPEKHTLCLRHVEQRASCWLEEGTLFMSFSLFRAATHHRRKLSGSPKHHHISQVLSLLLVCVFFISLALGWSIIPQANAQPALFDHTRPAVEASCTQAYYSP